MTLMDAASESDEIQKGLSHLCMSIIFIVQNVYSQDREKRKAKHSGYLAFKNP